MLVTQEQIIKQEMKRGCNIFFTFTWDGNKYDQDFIQNEIACDANDGGIYAFVNFDTHLIGYETSFGRANCVADFLRSFLVLQEGFYDSLGYIPVAYDIGMNPLLIPLSVVFEKKISPHAEEKLFSSVTPESGGSTLYRLIGTRIISPSHFTNSKEIEFFLSKERGRLVELTLLSKTHCLELAEGSIKRSRV
jgi:hypothetical protein